MMFHLKRNLLSGYASTCKLKYSIYYKGIKNGTWLKYHQISLTILRSNIYECITNLIHKKKIRCYLKIVGENNDIT